MPKTTKLEKAAKKAYKRAERAVDEAIEAAEALEGKLRAKAEKKAAKLRERLADEARGEGSGDRRAGASPTPDAGDTADGIDLTPPLPNVEDPDAGTAAEFAGSTATTAPHDPALDRMTAQALRDVARSRGLANVSRLSRAQLIERLSE